VTQASTRARSQATLDSPDEISYDPRTSEVVGQARSSTQQEVRHALASAAAAAPAVAGAAPVVRRRWLEALADALEAHAEELIELADRETGLGVARLTGEVARTAGQLRFYGAVAEEGSYLGAVRDDPDGTAPALARVNVPLGPVAVFGASNFPFAFSVLGNDTASALAAGCPVVVKAHPAHPLLSEVLAGIASPALAEAGAPEGTFALVAGYEAGTDIVTADETAAVAFTGSERGGMALWRLANQRERVIPVFAEMGTVNPAVVTPIASRDIDEIAAGFVGSFTLGSGQFCTKPGLLFAPRGCQAPAAVASALRAAAPAATMLTGAIATAVARGVEELLQVGASVVAQVAGSGAGWSADTTVLSTSLEALQPGSRLLEECFGPVALVVEYDDLATLHETLAVLPGALAASVFAADDDPDLPPLLASLSARVGRVAVNNWPTGVAYTWAQQHGGPWPATTQPAATSVGAAALGRFVRPVAWQNVPDAALPPALQTANPWGIPRRENGRLTS
jgi:NADP-dependent aldehyde dehydrogenase